MIDYQMAPNKPTKQKEAERESTKRAGANYKKTRAEILDELDEFLTKEVVERSAKAGYPELGAGIAAGVSALADLAVPADEVEAAITATGVGAAASKLSKVAKAGAARRAAAKRASLDMAEQTKQTERAIAKERAAEAPFEDDVLFQEGKRREMHERGIQRKRAEKQRAKAYLDKFNVK